MQVLSKSIRWAIIQHTEPLFWAFQSAGMTFEIRSRSPKSNEQFPTRNNVSMLVWLKSID